MYNKSVDRPIIFEDNAAAGILATTNVLNSKSKHMKLRFSICNEIIVENKVFRLWHLPTNFQLADINTKALNEKKFRSIDPSLRGLVCSSTSRLVNHLKTIMRA